MHVILVGAVLNQGLVCVPEFTCHSYTKDRKIVCSENPTCLLVGVRLSAIRLASPWINEGADGTPPWEPVQMNPLTICVMRDLLRQKMIDGTSSLKPALKPIWGARL